MEKICKHCKKVFEIKKKKQMFCSKSCASIYMNLQPGFIEAKSAFHKEYQNKPEVKKAHIKRCIESQNRPDVKKAKSESQKKYCNQLYVKERISKFQKEYQNRPEIKKLRSLIQKEYHNRIDIKEKYHKILKSYWNNPDIIKYHSNKLLELWSNSEYAHKVLISGKKFKNYQLPSGRIVKIQGYENLFLDEYFKDNSEDDIIIGIKNLNKEIGSLKYEQDGKIHTYYPDFYVKSTNTIIEVKSKWTYELHKEKNLAKEQACLQRGFNFNFKIYG